MLINNISCKEKYFYWELSFVKCVCKAKSKLNSSNCILTILKDLLSEVSKYFTYIKKNLLMNFIKSQFHYIVSMYKLVNIAHCLLSSASKQQKKSKKEWYASLAYVIFHHL
jgi:hypothetical protein